MRDDLESFDLGGSRNDPDDNTDLHDDLVAAADLGLFVYNDIRASESRHTKRHREARDRRLALTISATSAIATLAGLLIELL